MKVIQPPGVQWVVSLLQLKLGYVCDIFTPRVQSQEQMCYYDMVIDQERYRLVGSGVIMNFNDHTVTWDTDTIPMKDRDTCTLTSLEAPIDVYECK
jgi:hypothetical protein